MMEHLRNVLFVILLFITNVKQSFKVSGTLVGLFLDKRKGHNWLRTGRVLSLVALFP